VKRLLLPLVLIASLSSCAPFATLLGGAAVPPTTDARGATLTASQSPSCLSTAAVTCTTLTYLPGKTATLNTVVHLKGPKLRLNDTRCSPEPTGVLCTFGTVPADQLRVIYVTGYVSSTLKAARPDGSEVSISGR